MSRNKTSEIYSRAKPTKYTKAGLLLNRNGVPLDRFGRNAMKSTN